LGRVSRNALKRVDTAEPHLKKRLGLVSFPFIDRAPKLVNRFGEAVCHLAPLISLEGLPCKVQAAETNNCHQDPDAELGQRKRAR